ncbi:PREDICTED: RNA-binding protein 10 isoform X2 [Nelumbo nucifera]|uniref:RNA-binding protein 10 isoform X2 n=1 Tax=Nelumbo nucifera TaxID=4432 RepID=A0A1U7ZI02_NELNU|nr:PREDICTED: RNA-binding protein 10 isoform X2 [Nelumbo nucifera]
MAGTRECEDQQEQGEECSFVWDDESQLYFHASSGFYHDPNAGWYYSSRDNLYYKFENGNYVLLESNKAEESRDCQSGEDVSLSNIQLQDEPCHTECNNNDEAENPPPTSEWLEDTLIELYLTGYSKSAINAADMVMPLEVYDESNSKLRNDDSYEIEEGEWICEDLQNATESSFQATDESASQDEERWRAQYGQVVQSGEDDLPDFPVVDLWDWAMVKDSFKKKHQIVRLVGRLVKQSTKLHPSLPSGGGLLKTAAICEVHLDLNKGKAYRDRAAERRALYGGFGVGPGQKTSGLGDTDTESPSCSVDTEIAASAAEALNMSFGAGSYARRILESMGWKEGEALGNSTKGLLEPLQAVGNKGYAGLGWDQSRHNFL